jgi:hypothetical protein
LILGDSVFFPSLEKEEKEKKEGTRTRVKQHSGISFFIGFFRSSR